jgi:hypothetical protein
MLFIVGEISYFLKPNKHIFTIRARPIRKMVIHLRMVLEKASNESVPDSWSTHQAIFDLEPQKLIRMKVNFEIKQAQERKHFNTDLTANMRDIPSDVLLQHSALRTCQLAGSQIHYSS